jgi:uncharacterized protein YidB (DUF937 family)
VDPTKPTEPTLPGNPAAGSTQPSPATGDPLHPAAQFFGGPWLDMWLNQLRAAAYGPQVDSWISTNKNLAIHPEQLRAALGPETAQRIAAATGMTPDAASQMLANAMPLAVNHLSPTGQWPAPNEPSRMMRVAELGVLLGGLMRGMQFGAPQNLAQMLQGLGTPSSVPDTSPPSGPTTISSDLGAVTIPTPNAPDQGAKP